MQGFFVTHVPKQELESTTGEQDANPQQFDNSGIYEIRQCLDQGFLRLVTHMGNDNDIVQAARVSFGDGTKTVHEDRGLIRYLMNHQHTTPFEMVEFKFHVKLPIFVARQWIRHRTANVNEYSGRYSEMKDDFYIPEHDQIRKQSNSNKQGRSDEGFTPEIADVIQRNMEQHFERCYELYRDLLEKGVAKEISRNVLPVSNYTEWYWKIDLHNLFHFLRLRLDSHAQYEMRVYAEAIASIVKQIVPVAFEAFEEYILHSVKFSRLEIETMKKLLTFQRLANEIVEEIKASDMSPRERVEFLNKLCLISDEPFLKDIPRHLLK